MKNHTAYNMGITIKTFEVEIPNSINKNIRSAEENIWRLSPTSGLIVNNNNIINERIYKIPDFDRFFLDE